MYNISFVWYERTITWRYTLWFYWKENLKVFIYVHQSIEYFHIPTWLLSYWDWVIFWIWKKKNIPHNYNVWRSIKIYRCYGVRLQMMNHRNPPLTMSHLPFPHVCYLWINDLPPVLTVQVINLIHIWLMLSGVWFTWSMRLLHLPMSHFQCICFNLLSIASFIFDWIPIRSFIDIHLIFITEILLIWTKKKICTFCLFQNRALTLRKRYLNKLYW